MTSASALGLPIANQTKPVRNRTKFALSILPTTMAPIAFVHHYSIVCDTHAVIWAGLGDAVAQARCGRWVPDVASILGLFSCEAGAVGTMHRENAKPDLRARPLTSTVYNILPNASGTRLQCSCARLERGYLACGVPPHCMFG